jgi:hypothetical protein
MVHAKLVREEMREKDRLFLSTYLEMKNAALILLSEGEDQLGTLAVALPQSGKLLGPPLSSILLGDRNTTIARILAEHLAKKMSKIALVSVFIKTITEKEVGPILMKLVEKTIGEKEDDVR